MSEVMLSIVIATHNRSALLCRTIDSILAADWAAIDGAAELVIVANCCTDGTEDQVRTLFQRRQPALREGAPVLCEIGKARLEARFVSEPRLGLGWARRRCVDEARGAVLAFLDDDVLVDVGWPKGLMDAFADPGIEVAGGRVIGWWEACARPDWLTSDMEWVISIFDRGSEFRRLAAPEGIGANFAVRRSVFERIGNFDGELGRKGNKLSGGEESDLFRRMASFGVVGAYAGSMSVAHWVAPQRLDRSYFSKIAYHYGQDRIVIRGRGRRWRHWRSVAGHAALYFGYGLAAQWAWFRRDEAALRRCLIRAQIGRGGLAALLKNR